MKQPLNEAYHNEVLEAYQKISDTFDDFTQLMRKRIPYEEWPERLKIAGVSDSLKGEYEPAKDFKEESIRLTDECVGTLEEIIEKGWEKCQPYCRPDETFRAMLMVMKHWKKYLDAVQSYAKNRQSLHEILKAQGQDPMNAFGKVVTNRLMDMGRAHKMLVSALDSPLFEKLSKHDPYWSAANSEDDENDKLHDIRCQLSCLHDNLWDVVGSLVGDEDA